MNATPTNSGSTAELSTRAARSWMFANAAGLAALALGVLAGRLGVSFTGFLSVSVHDHTLAIPFARTLAQNLMAWPAAPIVWWFAMLPFGRARLWPVLSSTAVAHALIVLLGLYARSLGDPATEEPSASAIAVLTTAAVAVIVAVVVLVAVGARHATDARGWRAIASVVAAFVAFGATEIAIHVWAAH